MPSCSRLLVVLLALGAGCITYRIDEDVYVADVSLRLAEGSRVCPGARPELIASVVTGDARLLITRGAGGGRLDFAALSLETTLGSVEGGRLHVPADPRAIDVANLTVRATPLAHPQKTATLEVPIHYACRYVADFSGSDGAAGTSGSWGQSGSNGSAGAGGQDGQDGARGTDARPVEVRVRAVRRPGTSHALADLEIRQGNDERRYVVDPEGGGITIQANGGDGGNGGAGGSGGAGGAAEVERCDDAEHCHRRPRRGGGGGDGGDGGDGADGGDGGPIRVIATREAEPLLAALAFSNDGGSGGHGGAGGWGGTGGAGASDGRDGDPGNAGQLGARGDAGQPGPRVEIELIESSPPKRRASRR